MIIKDDVLLFAHKNIRANERNVLWEVGEKVTINEDCSPKAYISTLRQELESFRNYKSTNPDVARLVEDRIKDIEEDLELLSSIKYQKINIQ